MIRLDNGIGPGSLQGPEDKPQFRPIPSNGICTRLGDKWTVHVLWRLSLADEQRLRFSALRKEIDGITQRMLTLTLRNLERDGLVERTVYSEVPPRVEYALTSLGESLRGPLEAVREWADEHVHEVLAARDRYDEGTSARTARQPS